MKTENLSSFGTIFASFLAASCCIGPAILIVFGTSASFLGGLSFMESLRPYLLAAALLLFGFSFWKLYLKKSECKCAEDIKTRKMAYDTGTTKNELVEFLNVAITESGCPGEQWAMLALKTYSDLEAGITVDADICCHEEREN